MSAKGSWRWWVALLAPGCAAAAAAPPPPPLVIPPATVDDTLDIAGTSVEAIRRNARLAVGVTIDGRGPYRFVVDSGADGSVIGAGLAAELGLPAGPPRVVRATTGAAPAATVRVGQVQVGGSIVRDLTLPVLAEADLGAQGMLGIDALEDQRLLLDYERGAIVVQDARRVAAAPEEGEIVVTARRRRGQLILTQATAGGRPVQAVIDSGSEVTVGNEALRRRLFSSRRVPPTITPIELIGVTGKSAAADMIVLPEVTIGRLTFQGVPVAFADLPPFALFGLADQPALLLGADVLSLFRRVALDFRNRRIRFVLGRGR
ncbi:MAG: aspartyl protease family protein [Sphingomonas fennica]